MNRNVRSLVLAAAIAAVVPAIMSRTFGLTQLWASAIGIVLAMLVAYPVMRAKGHVSFAQWVVTVAVVALIAVTAQLLIR